MKILTLCVLLASATISAANMQTQALFNAYQIDHSFAQKQESPEELTQRLLHKYNLARPLFSPFSYAYKTEVYNSLMECSQPLHSTMEKMALEQHSYLNNSFFYKDIQILSRNPRLVRKYQIQHKPHSAETGELVTVQTEDGVTIHGTWLNRQKKKLVVVGGGFTNHREQMAPLGDLYHDYDVLFLDLRGHGIDQGRGFIKSMANIEAGTATFGHKEDLDVKAIVEYIRSRKKYDEVIGHGLCYSALMFVKAAALYPHLFDRLIIDGCWQSLYLTTQELATDLGKLALPQRHSRLHNNKFMQSPLIRSLVLTFAEQILATEFNTTSVLDYTPLLKDIPLLVVYSKDDALIPRSQFEQIWHSISAPRKTAVLTSAPHVWNHLHKKELYREICTLFIENDHEEFTRLLTSPHAYVAYKTDQLQMTANVGYTAYADLA